MNKKFVKICIFNPDSTPSAVKTSNGDVILDNICLQAITDEILDTGEYYLDCKFKVDNKLYKYIQEESILKVKVDYGNEYFRIAKIRKTSRDIVVFARQITISETLDMWLEDVRPEGQNGQGALSWILDNSKGKKDIRVFSDLENNSTAYYINISMYKALHDCDQSFRNRWGGEVQRRGYDLTINRKIGKHRGVQIRSRKNLKGFESNTNIDNLVTRIKPVGFNGITIDGYVDSPLINNYSSIKTREIKYEDIKVKTENDKEGFDTLADAQQELIKRANLEFTVNNLDKIRADYRVNFVQLEYTEEYKNYIEAERVYLGDEIDVYEETLDVDITVRSIRKRFDVISQKVIEIELSNEVKKDKPPSIGDISNALSKLETTTNEQNTWLENAINNANDLIHNGLKDSYVIVKQNEVLIMDTTDINTANNVWRWNSGGLAHSKNGYYGDYSTAITQDGSIVATMITSGILNANLLQTGVIRSKNKNFELNLDSGVMKVLNGAFKIVVDGKEDNIITQSKFEATSKEFLFRVEQTGKVNELENSDFSKPDYRWVEEGNTDKVWYEVANWYGGGVPFTTAIRFTDCTNTAAYIRQSIKPKNPKMTKFSVSGYAHYFNVNNTDGSGYPMCHWYCEIRYENGQSSYHNFDIRDYTSNDAWSLLQWNIDTQVPSNGPMSQINFYVYKRNTTGDLRVSQLYLHEGHEKLTWRPGGEIYSNTVAVDSQAVEVRHDNGSKSRLTHDCAEFTAANGNKVTKIKDGGMNFYTWNTPELVGFIKPSILDGDNVNNGVSISTYRDGDFISIGHTNSNDENVWTSTPNIFMRKNSYGGVEPGTHIMNMPLYLWTTAYLKGIMHIESQLHIKSSTQYVHQIFNWASMNYLGIYGDGGVSLGIRGGGGNKNNLELRKDTNAVNQAIMNNWCNWDFHNYFMNNMQISKTLQAQSFALRARTKDINTSYGSMTLTEGEIRYVCRETQIINNTSTDVIDGKVVNKIDRTLLVELPQILSENIENNYHVNISKMSWGDYRIIEKTPYYFVIETDRDEFSFTYEIIAKHIEKPNAYVSIAKSSFLELDEPEKDDNQGNFSFVDLAEGNQGYWTLYRRKEVI